MISSYCDDIPLATAVAVQGAMSSAASLACNAALCLVLVVLFPLSGSFFVDAALDPVVSTWLWLCQW